MIHGPPQAPHREEVLHHAIRHLLITKSSLALQPVSGAHVEKIGSVLPMVFEVISAEMLHVFFTFAPLKFIPF